MDLTILPNNCGIYQSAAGQLTANDTDKERLGLNRLP